MTPEDLMYTSERRDDALLRRYHRTGDTAARDELVEHGLPLVRSLARRYAGRGEHLDDLVQVGCVGLLKAIDRYDPDAGHRFVSFAAPNITGEIKRHFRDHSWTVHVPRSIQELDARVEEASTRMSAATGRAPGVAELAAELGEPEERVREAIRGGRAHTAFSLDHPTGDGKTAIDLVGQTEDGYRTAEDRTLIRAACRGLDARDRKIVGMRFVGDRLQREIAEEVGVSQMQVSRLLRRAVCRMRDEVDREQRDPRAPRRRIAA
jgi:RNA polymerase sigma-B factor